MKEKVNKYLEDTFKDIPSTKQLVELKDEIRSNLLASVDDYKREGRNEEEAYNMAIERMGDMRELATGLKDTNYTPNIAPRPMSDFLSKGHIIGYVVTTTIFLFGLISAAMLFVQGPELAAQGYLGNVPELRAKALFGYYLGVHREAIIATIGMLMVSMCLCIPAYTFLGLTQDSEYTYPMNKKRAGLYTLGVGVILFGGFAAVISYLSTAMLFVGIATLIPFWVPAIGLFVYLGLTERDRTKMNEKWANEWIAYYTNPKTRMIHEAFSGGLWILTIGAVILVAMIAGFKFCWIPFVVAVALQVIVGGIINAIAQNK